MTISSRRYARRINGIPGKGQEVLKIRCLFSVRITARKVGHKVSISGQRKKPYEESIKVPLIMRLPGVFAGNRTCDTLTSPVDHVPIPLWFIWNSTTSDSGRL